MSPVKLTRGKPVNLLVGQYLSPSLARAAEAILPSNFVSNLREGRSWKNWIAKLEPNLFDDLSASPAETKKSLFKKHVSLVEIEVHARCNRVCPFCPNVIVDRRKNFVLTDAEILDRVFDELGSIDYRGQIKIARYSEPLANLPYLYDRIVSARTKVPNAQLAIVTNTDYLKPKVLEELREAGLDRVYMSIYPRPREKWSLALAERYSERLAAKLRTPISSRHRTTYSLRCTYKYEGLQLHSACINFGEFGSDRGNLMEQYTHEKRLGPCREPFETFVIDYTGDVMPCCNLRGDFPEHRALAAGNLARNGSSIFDVYAGALAGWRKSMAGFGPKEKPCTTCTHRDVPHTLANKVSRLVNRRLVQIGRD